MKRLTKMINLMLLFLSLMLLCGACTSRNKEDNSVRKIQQNGVLNICTSADYAPFEFPIIENGRKKIVGYDILLAEKIADELGVKLKVINTEYPSLISELRNGKADLAMAGMVSTPERKKVVSFSKNYYTMQNVLLIQKKNKKKFTTVKSLKNKSVGAQQTTTQEQIAKKQLKYSNVISEANLNSLASELKQGQLSGLVVEKGIAKSYLENRPDDYAVSSLKLRTPLENKHVNIALRKSDKKLKAKIDSIITKLNKSGELKKMFEKAQKLQLKNQ